MFVNFECSSVINLKNNALQSIQYLVNSIDGKLSMKSILTTKEVHELVNGGAQIVDVRSHMEFRQDAIKGAINMPLENLHQEAKGLDDTKPVVVYCRTGGRSAKAQEVLLNQGFKAVHNAGSLSNFN